MRAPDAHGVFAVDNAAHELCRRPGLVGVIEDAPDGGDVGGVFIGGGAQALVLVSGNHDVVLAGEGQGLRRGGHRRASPRDGIAATRSSFSSDSATHSTPIETVWPSLEAI